MKLTEITHIPDEEIQQKLHRERDVLVAKLSRAKKYLSVLEMEMHRDKAKYWQPLASGGNLLRPSLPDTDLKRVALWHTLKRQVTDLTLDLQDIMLKYREHNIPWVRTGLWNEPDEV